MTRYIKADKLYPTNFEIYTYAGDYKKALEAVYEKIDNAPAEDVAPVVHAKWIPKQFGNCECSNCHEEYGVCGGLLGDYNYCPNCGAKMGENND